ncbi:hypothetical protein [Candidatus Magnetaquicoccus inordinatus]|uniref:hypothetical protein n=1 Tax=Candidatus Magnetaquicoccus inordinatus TaxID=2496818 RepID=UPI00187D2B5C|nr:hypothetical protein [Candidatus Magnetaquicoccus inordinatus]
MSRAPAEKIVSSPSTDSPVADALAAQPLRLGIDLDNTLIYLDGLFFQQAQQRGWFPAQPVLDKTAVREALRQRADGEKLWQSLQAEVYGPALWQAPLMAGADSFLRHCRAQGVELFIVSHKSHHAGQGSERADIRATASAWLRERGFFQPEGLAFAPEHVYYEATRQEKLARIGQLQLHCFIDDLPEVLLDPHFPASVRPIWFNPAQRPALPGIASCCHWQEMQRHVFV